MSQNRRRPDATRTARTAGARSPAERLAPGRAPSRPRGLDAREPSRVVSGFVHVISGVLTIALVGMLIIGGTAFVIFNQYESPGPLTEVRTVIIPKGEGRIAIAERLEREGIITNRWTFVGGHLLQGFVSHRKNSELKAGEYQIKEHASMRDVIDTLSEGKSILYKTTLPEGLTSGQIVERLRADPNLTGEIAMIPEEGTLLPDTYYYSKGASRQEIIDRMQGEMQKALSALWETRDPDLPIRSEKELVTFASIVEKETGRADERERVAGVFYNRLRKGMRLQSDPTIIYGIVGTQGVLGRGITRADIDAKSPYNTYQINGLPPGPICNPGKSSLEAGLKPAKTNELYFVADGTGGHAFSETLKDHNSAVQKWRAVEKQAREKLSSDANSNAAPIPPSAGDAPAPAVAPVKGSKTAKASSSGHSNASDAGSQADASPDDDASDTEPRASGGVPLPVRKPKKP
ncbi:endolytic transglycosylase MltG [Hyphomicrobium methylovorum]|uniref:endolytic transglycosylase MltG n=1 Tax=Hyphomicrobium methylovorum TaxID=84 RepID=UPI0015E63827|nr:endolytic transglycosylase MltG [Hyphomicrobium methylovorum]MBA2127755.1 endolytic transglycosylase MltG [Hyphomicrobium methylovorum]